MADENEIKEQPTTGQKLDWKKLISHKWVVKNIPFFLFLTLLAVLYIYNGHYADKLVLKITTTEKKNKRTGVRIQDSKKRRDLQEQSKRIN